MYANIGQPACQHPGDNILRPAAKLSSPAGSKLCLAQCVWTPEPGQVRVAGENVLPALIVPLFLTLSNDRSFFTIYL
ncbi:major facilitator superfamily protein [Anopheles sinensis]|uniref:Major facilitator superfamily protein n=1 Tax=Anopheles sinensis TaxID=74873 RepID=A0A084WSK6_ANOSI|nr:major facilitator superfamily protein [Anopheles sinensis]